MQGKLACISSADQSISHSIFKNASIDEDIQTFTAKSRLQVLPTRFNLSVWYPNSFTPFCIHHGQTQVIESMSHVLNGCTFYKKLYISRHDRIIDLLLEKLQYVCPSPVTMYTNCVLKSQMFALNQNPTAFNGLNATKPDITIIDEDNRTVDIVEVGCCFDSYLEETFCEKLMKYQPLVQEITVMGYKCQYIVLVFGSLGHVHRLATRGLRMLGFPKMNAKSLLKYCSISSIIGSRHIWRRRCCVYP